MPNDSQTQTDQPGSLHPACSACGGPVRGRRICSRCAALILAAIIEEPSPGETIKQIHQNEQTGASLRKMASRPNT